jgi:hypothetical protein
MLAVRFLLNAYGSVDAAADSNSLPATAENQV